MLWIWSLNFAFIIKTNHCLNNECKIVCVCVCVRTYVRVHMHARACVRVIYSYTPPIPHRVRYMKGPTVPFTTPHSWNPAGSFTELMVTPGPGHALQSSLFVLSPLGSNPAILHLTTNVKEYWFGSEWQRPDWDSCLCTIVIKWHDLHAHRSCQYFIYRACIVLVWKGALKKTSLWTAYVSMYICQ